MNKNSLLNQIYICPIGADGIQEVAQARIVVLRGDWLAKVPAHANRHDAARFDAVLALVKDEDEDIRRTAVEILNATKDERAVDHLMKATDDSDWWVRERAVDALAHIGSTKAVPKLVKMLGDNPKTDTVVIRALGKLGDHSVLKNLIPLLKNSPRATKVEAIKAISHLADESHADTIRNVLLEVKQSEDATIMNSADKAIKEIDARFSSAVIEENVRAGKMADSALASAFVRKLTCMVIS